MLVKSSNSFTFSLLLWLAVWRVQHLGLVLNLIEALAAICSCCQRQSATHRSSCRFHSYHSYRTSHLDELRAPSLHLWATPSAMSGRTCSGEELVDTVGDMLVDLTHTNHHVERFLIRDIVGCDDAVCVPVVAFRGRPEMLLSRVSLCTGILN